MENATKALLIAGGVLVAIIILSILVLTFQKYGNVSKTYDSTVNQEEITKFNSNFTKYLNQELTIHEAITITNFAESNKVTVKGRKTTNDIANSSGKYKLEILDYADTGEISSIKISNS